LTIISVENSPMEVFHMLTPYRRKLTLIIKDSVCIISLSRHTSPL